MSRLALECDDAGRIRHVIRDDLGLVPDGTEAVMLPALGTPHGSSRCFEMLQALGDESAVFGWLIELRTPSGAIGLHFAGVQRDRQVLLVASRDLADVSDFTEELERISSDQVTQLRELVKERAQLQHATTVMPEITELDNANTALQREVLRQRTELEQLLRAKNELLGMAAHDLRNPLSAIVGLLELLQVDDAVIPGHRPLLDEALCASQMLTRILDGVLDVTAIESGVLRLDLDPCDLVALVQQSTSLHRLRADRMGIQFLVRGADAVEVSADASKLMQVLNNLIDNAIEHAPRDSVITVDVRRARDEVLVAVEDQGPGVPDDAKHTVFDAFRRGDHQSTRRRGLGLAIARRIATGHGGRLTVGDGASGGARFELALPVPER